MIGQTIGTYRIEQKIGEGGMGMVYRGRDVMLDREVAVKSLRPELARQPELVARFVIEAKTLARLHHPNIAAIYSFQPRGDDYFMVMEFVHGQTLERMIEQAGAPTCREDVIESAQIFCQALEAIAYAHSLGIIHRDIKPANVMLADTGEAKVMDFGIVRVLGTARATQTGRVLGTFEYMSPEQTRGQETDARSDIYSLGILLYEILAGRVPFQADSEYALMHAQVTEPPAPPRDFNQHIPPAVELAILRALAKDPAARFQSAGEFRAALISAVPEAALKPQPRKLPVESPIKATRIGEAAGDPFASPGFNGQPIRSTGQTGGRGYDANTGTFTLKLPSFLQGPFDWKHYAGAGVAALALVIGGLTLRPGTDPTPRKPDNSQGQGSPIYTPPVPMPSTAPVIEPLPEESSSSAGSSASSPAAKPVVGRRAVPAPAKAISAPTPRPQQQQQAAHNDRPQHQQQAAYDDRPPQRPEPSRAQPTPSPTPEKKKFWQKVVEVGAGVAGEVIRKKRN